MDAVNSHMVGQDIKERSEQSVTLTVVLCVCRTCDRRFFCRGCMLYCKRCSIRPMHECRASTVHPGSAQGSNRRGK